jgi:hypothetical protein
MTAGPGRAALSPPGLLPTGAPLTRQRVSRGLGAATTLMAARGTVALTLVAVLLAATALYVFRGPLGLTPVPSRDVVMPTSAGIEATWGVRFTQIGLSADGGMVDVRYVVLDIDKAMSLAADVDSTPLLVDEESQRVIFAVAMKAHAHDLHTGGRYYLLYRNTNGLLEPGRRVTITVGGERLEHALVLGTKGG